MRSSEKIIDRLIQGIKNHFADQVQVHYKKPVLELKTLRDQLCVLTAEFAKEGAEDTKKKTSFVVSAKDSEPSAVKFVLPPDLMVTKEKQLLSILQSKLQLNKKVFARNCAIKKINAPEARTFINKYHLMGYANSAYHVGLFLKDELIGVAAFSKGRKMNRLEAHQRSYELVRFCCKEGITVTGGLSRLLKFFIDEKHPGDIMTYIDKQFGEGDSYLKYGFKKHSETPAQQFLVNKKTFERTYYKGESIDKKEFYLTENSGNIKLVYTIEKQQV